MRLGLRCLGIAFLIACGIPVSSPAPAELPRRGFLGIVMAPDRQTGNGVVVTGIVPGGTAAELGIRSGDVVVRVDGLETRTPVELAGLMADRTGGSPILMAVRRDGGELELRGRIRPRPLERYDNARVEYGEVPFRDGRLREIIVTPEGAAAPPVLFLIQGFSCATVESPTYRRLGEALVREGIGFYRVEKPGVGDSEGGPHCTEIDYRTELDAFRAAYRRLRQVHGIDQDRIFMFGHSLGGLQAPMLAAEVPPRGIAVFGTVLRSWADYHRDISQFQEYLIFGGDLAEQTRQAEPLREAFRRFYFLRESPGEIASALPALAPALRERFGWDGGDLMFGRHFRFSQDLAHLPLIASWRDARTHVLSMYGEHDFVALFDVDHRLIADLANSHRPGTGTYVEVEGTGHAMDLTLGRERIREQARATGAPPQGEFNPEVGRILAEWISERLRTPPVRLADSLAGEPPD